MENYDTGNYGDGMDFEGQQAAIARALRQAQSLADNAYAGVTRPRANPLHYVANYLAQRNADAEMSAAEKKAAEFGAARDRKITDLVTQISTPGAKRVLKQTLGGDDAPLGGQNVAPPTAVDEPLDPVAENQRQMGLAMQLSRVDPKLAAPFITSGASFPETMARMRLAGEDRASQAKDKQEFQASQNATYKRTADIQDQVARGMLSVAQGNAATQRMLAEDKISRGKEPSASELIRADKKATAQTAAQLAAQGMIGHFDAIDRNINKLLGPDTTDVRTGAVIPGKVSDGLHNYVGTRNQYLPRALMKDSTADAGTAFDALKDQVMLGNLAEAKKTVGQSFGSMQLKEWDKFTNQLAALNRDATTESNADSLRYIRKYVKEHRDVIQKVLEAQPAATTASKEIDFGSLQ